jgi:hypothetical protein
MLFTPFLSEMGRIKSRFQTGLSAKSQRKVAKAIRRARAMGIMPIHSRPTPRGAGFPIYWKEDDYMH